MRTTAIFLIIGIVLVLASCVGMAFILPKGNGDTLAAREAIAQWEAIGADRNAEKTKYETEPKVIREQGIADVNLAHAVANAQADLILARTQAYVVTWELKQKESRANYWRLLIAVIVLAGAFVITALTFAEYERWRQRKDN